MAGTQFPSFCKFDVNDFGEFSTAEQVVKMARDAEAAERYEDMCVLMRKRVTDPFDKELSIEERNLLSVAYKNVIGCRRASWRVLNDPVAAGYEGPLPDDHLRNAYKDMVVKELKDICADVLSLLEEHLIDRNNITDREEEQVFYLKMAGDYYRYLTETVEDKETEKQKCSEYYAEAFEIAKEHLKPTHPIRLGLALNYSVCWYEILKDHDKACELAKTAFDEAISKLDHLEEADYKDATLIMQLLRDNLTLWTQNGKSEGEDAPAE